MTLTLAEFIALRRAAPAKLDQAQQQAVADAAALGLLQLPKLDAQPTPGFAEILAGWDDPRAKAVWDRFGGWQIGSICGCMGMVTKALRDSLARPM